MNDNHLIHPNLALAREHFENFAFDRLSSGETATLAIAAPLECEATYQGETGRPYLPGDTLGDIVANLNTALILCREQAPLPNTGRNRSDRFCRDVRQRQDLALCIRVCLALLGTGCEAGAQP